MPGEGFPGNIMEEKDVKNTDETHFKISLDNGHTQGFKGDDEVKYVDIVSGCDGMTMVVCISGGRDVCILLPFIMFKNKHRNYPMRGLPDDLEGVSYRTGPKGWMDTTVMPEWLKEEQVFQKLPHDRTRILYVENCSGHNSTAQLSHVCAQIKTEIR